MTRRYVYTLAIEYPEGVDWRNPPERWEPSYWEDPDGQYATTFHWPQERAFLSLSGARRRAALLRRYGCQVVLMRAPVGEPTVML